MFSSPKQAYLSAYRDIRVFQNRRVVSFGDPVSVRMYRAAEQSRRDYLHGVPEYRIQFDRRIVGVYQIMRKHRWQRNHGVCPCRYCLKYWEVRYHA